MSKFKVTMEGSNVILSSDLESYGFYAILIVEAEDGEVASARALEYCRRAMLEKAFWPKEASIISEPLIYVAGVDLAADHATQIDLTWFKEKLTSRVK